MLDMVNGQLSALKVSEAERKEVAQPFVEFIGIDLHNIYFSVFERLLMLKQQELTRRKDAAGNTPEAQKVLQSFFDEKADWQREVVRLSYQQSKPYD
ncbi:MAG: hypothetical protein WCC64_00040, partial [Aliidongia sp.]